MSIYCYVRLPKLHPTSRAIRKGTSVWFLTLRAFRVGSQSMLFRILIPFLSKNRFSKRMLACSCSPVNVRSFLWLYSASQRPVWLWIMSLLSLHEALLIMWRRRETVSTEACTEVYGQRGLLLVASKSVSDSLKASVNLQERVATYCPSKSKIWASTLAFSDQLRRTGRNFRQA